MPNSVLKFTIKCPDCNRKTTYLGERCEKCRQEICFACKGKLNKYKRDKNVIYQCENKKCSRFLDMSKVKHWIRA